MYFVPHGQIVREDGPDNSFDDSSKNTYRLSVAFNTDEAGVVMVLCDTTYSYGYLGICNTSVKGDKYSGPLKHYPELD